MKLCPANSLSTKQQHLHREHPVLVEQRVQLRQRTRFAHERLVRIIHHTVTRHLH